MPDDGHDINYRIKKTPQRASFFAAHLSLLQERFQIRIDIADPADMELLNEHVDHGRGEEGG